MLAADLPSYAFERAAEKLTAGPRVFARLVEMMLDPRTDIPAVADLLQRDAVLSGRILRVANSAAIGGQASGAIADLPEALQRVGLSEVYRIVGIAVTLQSAHASLGSYGIGCSRMRENSLYEAVAAEAIQTVLGGDHRMAYAGGLLRNYGRLLLDRVVQLYRPHSTFFPESTFGSLVDWERDNFRTTGAQAGADLMLKWNFPEPLVLAVRQVAAPIEQRRQWPLATVLSVAAAMAAEAGHGLPGEVDTWADDAEARKAIDLDGAKRKQAHEMAEQAFGRWRALMH